MIHPADPVLVWAQWAAAFSVWQMTLGGTVWTFIAGFLLGVLITLLAVVGER